MKIIQSKFSIGAIVRHRIHDFRGVVFDVDPEFDNSDEWYQSIPAEKRPKKDQPFYHLLAENPENYYVAYVSEQNLVEDSDNGPVSHPEIGTMFTGPKNGSYKSRAMVA
jgi:heat shock protein HspQ